MNPGLAKEEGFEGHPQSTGRFPCNTLNHLGRHCRAKLDEPTFPLKPRWYKVKTGDHIVMDSLTLVTFHSSGYVGELLAEVRMKALTKTPTHL